MTKDKPFVPREPVAHDLPGNRRLTLLASREYQGGVLEAWEIKQFVERWFLLFSLERHAADKTVAGRNHWIFGAGSRSRVIELVANPPKLAGWTRAGPTAGFDSAIFSVEVFARCREEHVLGQTIIQEVNADVQVPANRQADETIGKAKLATRH